MESDLCPDSGSRASDARGARSEIAINDKSGSCVTSGFSRRIPVVAEYANTIFGPLGGDGIHHCDGTKMCKRVTHVV
jgi:hypothetical protein